MSLEASPAALLLSSISSEATTTFESNGIAVGRFNTDDITTADQLADALQDFSALGVRSGPDVPPKVLVPSLDVIAVYGNGTNHITRTTESKDGADDKGVAIINASVENTRSVAELDIALILGLARGFPIQYDFGSQGKWAKHNGLEVRGETLGIIGHGAIGTQISVLAQALGMDVLAYDKHTSNVHQGRAQTVHTLDELIERSRFVTINTPLNNETRGMIDAKVIAKMKDKYLINAARSELMDTKAVIDALHSGHLAGLGVDVYDGADPAKYGDAFDNPYDGVPNVLQTHHIGGSTVQAQDTIGSRVSQSASEYLLTGNSLGAINIPRLNLGTLAVGTSRLLNIHDSHPGVSQETRSIVAEAGLNIIEAQLLAPKGSDVGYEAIDVEGEIPSEVVIAVNAMAATRRARSIVAV